MLFNPADLFGSLFLDRQLSAIEPAFGAYAVIQRIAAPQFEQMTTVGTTAL